MKKDLWKEYIPERKPQFWDEEQKWPRDPSKYLRFKRDLTIPPFNHQRVMDQYKQLMERELVGYNMVVLDHTVIKMPIIQWKEGEKVTKEVDRYLVKVERDAWIREPNPVLTRWEAFKLWLFRKPRPESPKPDRFVSMYDLSGMQFRIFRDVWFRNIWQEEA